MRANAFDGKTQVADLYRDTSRIQQRTSALHAAKISSSDVPDTIRSILERHAPKKSSVLDVGCGRGTTTVSLASELPNARVVAVDSSIALLGEVERRARSYGRRVQTVCGDFHALPFRQRSFDVALAAFCLYHSETPGAAVAEIARCVRRGGRIILITKSLDSYQELDELVAAADLDRAAVDRTSLYTTFHSENFENATSDGLDIERVIHEEHKFRFADLSHVARYLATSPKYAFEDGFKGSIETILAALRAHVPDHPIETNSIVTYVIGTPR
jgi:ubiquinone/menaquinone biosynthesis C-methylase UbiE